MPYTKAMLHYIWATKNRLPLISNDLKPILLDHIKENSFKKEIHIDCLNCVQEHIHLLISLGNEQTISKVAGLIKGESSFWVNQQKIIPAKFEWQDDYIALSVSQSGISKVQEYIAKQEEHHRTKTFAQEYDEFLKAHGFSASNFG